MYRLLITLVVVVLGWGFASAQELFPLQALPPAAVINASNPVSASTITDHAGNVWSFGTVINAAYGGYHVLRQGAAQDTPSVNGTWQLMRDSAGSVWAMDMAGFEWYNWRGGAWVATGTAPPVAGPGMPALLEVFPNTLTDTSTLRTWLGRTPDTIGGLPSGPLAYFGFDGFFSPPGKDAWLFNITYRADVCTNAAGNVGCPRSPTAYMSDFVGLAAGKYDALMINQLQTFVLPQAANIKYVRVNSEWAGNFWDFSPWFGSTELQGPCDPSTGNGVGYGAYGCGVVPPSVWVPATQHMITVLRNILLNGPGGNPNIKIQFDAPADDTQAQYYPGDGYVDSLGTDEYVASSTPTNSKDQFMFYMNHGGGFTDNAYELTFAQKHNKPFVYPEWCDASQAPNEVDNVMITLFSNLFASVQGPGNAAIVAHGYWDYPPSNGGFQCDFTHDPAKQAAFAQPYPNGFQGTSYNGAFFSPLAPMPVPNPWQP
jgi:hypothetical protein